MGRPDIIVIGNSETAERCRRFFTKYGFRVSNYLRTSRLRLLDDAAPAGSGEPGTEGRITSNCPVVLATGPVRRVILRHKLHALGVPDELIIRHSYLYSLWMENLVDSLSFNSDWSPNEYVSYLLSHYPASGHNAIRVLAQCVSQKIEHATDRKKKTIGVYHATSAYRENLGSQEMYQGLKAQGYNVVYLFGKICGDQFESLDPSYFVGNGIIEYIEGIDILITSGLSLSLPKGCTTVYFVHDIYDSPAGRNEAARNQLFGPPRESPSLDRVDYSFLPSRCVMPSHKYSPDLRYPRVRTRPYCCIPGGYPKLDSNLRKIQAIAGPLDSIVYAPTVIGGNFAKYVSLPEYGQRIIDTLLTGFPSYRIIFRPHPHTLSTQYVKDIVARFSTCDKFSLDDNGSSYLDSYGRSALMVTDMSGTAYTFAFTTGRPVVFFSHREHDVAKAFKVSYYADREKVGCVATNLRELQENVALCLAEPDRMTEQVRRFRAWQMFNVGRSEQYFVDNFHHIAEDSRNPDWEYVVCPKAGRGFPDINLDALAKKLTDAVPLSMRLRLIDTVESLPKPVKNIVLAVKRLVVK